MNHTRDQQEAIFYKRHARVKRMIDGCSQKTSMRTPRDPRQLRRCLRILAQTQAYLFLDNPAQAGGQAGGQAFRKAISKTY